MNASSAATVQRAPRKGKKALAWLFQVYFFRACSFLDSATKSRHVLMYKTKTSFRGLSGPSWLAPLVLASDQLHTGFSRYPLTNNKHSNNWTDKDLKSDPRIILRLNKMIELQNFINGVFVESPSKDNFIERYKQ